MRSLIFVCAVFAAHSLAGGLVAADDGDMYSDIYWTLDDARPCVRLLTVDGRVGCATPPEGRKGTLRLVNDADSLDRIVAHPPDEDVSLVMNAGQLTKANYERLHAALTIAGIIVVQNFTGPSGGYSTDQADIWNIHGNGLADEDIPFAIITLEEKESDMLLRRARENERWHRDGNYPSHTAEFHYEMTAKTNSLDCFKSSKCLPVGGYSVWSTLGDLPANDDKRLVFVTTTLDSTSLFHDMVPGVDDAVSGTVTALAAFAALAATPGVTALPRRLVFGFFNGEAFDHVGSRKFLADVGNFTCTKFKDGAHTACREPFMPDLEFQRLSLDRIDSVIDVRQVAVAAEDSKTFFLHSPDNGGRDQMSPLFTSMASTVGGTATLSTLDDLPPSSAAAFLAVNTSTPVAIFTDHLTNFSNK